jgi:transcriptional regulator with XRE-family HTH domain
MRDGSTLGERIAAVRKRRGLSQRALAAAADLSISSIRKIEQDENRQVRLETAHKLAVALGVTTSALMTEPDAPVPAPESRQLWEPVRLALEGQHVSQPDGDLTVAGARRAFMADAVPLLKDGRFAELGVVLPVLLRDTDALVTSTVNGERDAALTLRAQVRQLTGALMLHQWQFSVAERAFDLAMADAPGPLTKMAIVDERAWGLTRQGRLAETVELAFGMAAASEPKMTASREELASYAKLLIRGAMAAVRDNRPDESEDALRLARMAAVGTGPYFQLPQSWHGFGPASVAMSAAEAAMIQDKPDAVLAVAERLRATRADSPLWSGAWSFMLDVACAHATLRQDEQAVAILRRLRHDRPQWFPRQRYAADILAKIISHRRTLNAEMRELADAVSLPL